MNWKNFFDWFSTDTFRNHDGELVERMAGKRRGHDVQILRFNGNNEDVLVKVNNSVEQMPLDRAGKYIKSMTEDE